MRAAGLTAKVTSFTGLWYYVTGEVRHPGRYEFWEGVTVTGGLEAAYGFTKNAQIKKAKLIHLNGKSETLNLANGEDPGYRDPVLAPRDRIQVPQK